MHFEIPERFESKIERVTESGCWVWLGPTNGKGYGRVRVGGGKKKYVHRLIYELRQGAIPDGRELDHLCRVTYCVNPDHLDPVTHHENVIRGNAGLYNSIKTHCHLGHPFDEGNTIPRKKRGGRVCKACLREHMRRYRKMAKARES